MSLIEVTDVEMPDIEIPMIAYELSFINSKDTLITQESRERLMSPTGKLDDLIIEAFMSANSISEYDLFVLSSTAATQIAQYGNYFFKNKQKLALYSFIAGPVFDREREHWNLLFIDVKKKKNFI